MQQLKDSVTPRLERIIEDPRNAKLICDNTATRYAQLRKDRLDVEASEVIANIADRAILTAADRMATYDERTVLKHLIRLHMAERLKGVAEDQELDRELAHWDCLSDTMLTETVQLDYTDELAVAI